MHPSRPRRAKKGLVSIIVPTKNEAENLQRLFTSLKTQSYRNFEVIINDDDKTLDNTSSIISKFSSRLDIKHIHDNRSLAHGRLQGSKTARGEFMLHLDADMELTRDVLKSCVEVIKLGFGAVVIPEIGVGVGFWNTIHSFEKSLYVGDDSVESARFFSTVAYWTVGGYNERMVLFEDKDMDLRIRAAGYGVGRTTQHLYHHEKNFSPIRSLKKKFFYGKTSSIFISSHPRQALKQANLIFRPAYFRHWKKLLTHPVLTVVLLGLKVLETLAVLVGLVSTWIPMFEVDPWKKNS